jgi:hypothetical protein
MNFLSIHSDRFSPHYHLPTYAASVPRGRYKRRVVKKWINRFVRQGVRVLWSVKTTNQQSRALDMHGQLQFVAEMLIGVDAAVGLVKQYMGGVYYEASGWHHEPAKTLQEVFENVK